MKNNEKNKQEYMTVSQDEGDNYREIADIMTELGFQMNHSSARNYVVRVMRKFAEAYAEAFDKKLSVEMVDAIAKSALFQSGVSDLLNSVETERRLQTDIDIS